MYQSEFQFYDSPIKRGRILLHRRPRSKFQFYDSPIKSFFSDFIRFSARGFNSMIVRLKESGEYEIMYFTSFQFYDSPIKRTMKNVDLESPVLFQFYDSPIKSTQNI